jgi:hypothetical protein
VNRKTFNKNPKLIISVLAAVLFFAVKSYCCEEIYLSDLTYSSGTIGWGTIHLDQSVGAHTITLNGVTFAKGIGTHANSDIIYNLNGDYTRFQTSVGVDDEVPTSNTYASVIFKVYKDGVLAYTSGTMGSTSATAVIDLNTTGCNQLKLTVNDANGSINSDHADWADARVTEVESGWSPTRNPDQIADYSSTSGLPGLALDGNTNGAWSGGSVTHTPTTGQTNPWWYWDMGSVKNISTIKLYNRTDECCSARMVNIR